METPAARVKPSTATRATPAAASLATVAVPSTTARVIRDSAHKSARAAITANRTRHAEATAAAASAAEMPMPAARDEIAMSTLPRRSDQRLSQGTPRPSRGASDAAAVATTLFPTPGPAPLQPQTGARRPRAAENFSDEVLLASPAARGPRPEVSAAAAATAARSAAMEFARAAFDGPMPTAAGSTPADLWGILAPEEEPMTATQEALPAADGYAPASPPPLFSLRSVSMDRGEGSPDVAAPASSAPAPPTVDDATRAMVWASSAKAYFDLIDSRPLRIDKNTVPGPKPPLPTAGRAAPSSRNNLTL